MKLLHLKYKMHKLVNLVFYLIIFAIGFLLGFGAEKINFNKLISQFLLIDNVSAEEYVGKTITVNQYRPNKPRYIHLTALIKTDEDVKANSVIKTVFRGTKCVNVTSDSNTGATIFSDNSGDVGNSSFVEEISSDDYTHNQIVTQVVDGTDVEVFMHDRVLISTPNTPYIKVPILFFGNIPYSCEIKDIFVIINGKQKEIIKLGSFFNTELITITDSSVDIEIVNSGFYEFAQKIFGEVSEENKFIYDFITFGLVATCFTLFVLVVGYIFNKFFGG